MALLISVNLHLWVLVALAASWSRAQAPESEPEIIELSRFELPPPPAPVEGKAAELAPQPDRAARPEERPVARAVHKNAPRRLQPEVRWSVSVAEAPSPQLEPKLRLIAQEEADLRHCLQRLAEEREPALRPLPKQAVSDPPPEDLPFHAHDAAGPPESLPPVTEPGGSQLALIELIQRRIDRVSPLVHRTAWGCRAFGGQARVRFLMNAQGYPIGYQVLDSTGSACLDEQIDTVLHLAEPYPRVAGWIPVRVTFRHRGT